MAHEASKSVKGGVMILKHFMKTWVRGQAESIQSNELIMMEITRPRTVHGLHEMCKTETSEYIRIIRPVCVVYTGEKRARTGL